MILFELLNLQKQNKIVDIYLFLVIDFASWDNCNIKLGNLCKYRTQIWQ